MCHVARDIRLMVGHLVYPASIWRRAELMDLSETATWPLTGQTSGSAELRVLHQRLFMR
jgi:hypothetical protein